MTDGDRPFLAELDGAVMTEQLELGAWPEAARAPLLELQLAARRRDRAERFPHRDDQLVLLDGRPVGAFTVDRSPERVVVVDIAVIPAVRGRGIASTVVRALTAEADRAGRPVRATVRSDNRASRRLFARGGFRELHDDGLVVSLERP